MEQAETLCAALSDETRVCRALADALRREQLAVVELRADAVLASLTERTELGAALADAACRGRRARGHARRRLGARERHSPSAARAGAQPRPCRDARRPACAPRGARAR